MHWRTFLILLWLAACGLLGTIVFQRAHHPPVNDIWTAIALGGIFGAVGLMAAWLVFGRSPLVARFLLSVIALLIFSWLLSLISEGSEGTTMGWLIFQGPLAIGAVIGLAILRWCGWRLHGPENVAQVVANDRSRRFQFSLGALLWMVGGVALLLGIARWLGSYDVGYVVIRAILGGAATLAVVLAWIRGFWLFRCGVGALALGALFAGFCSDPIGYIDPQAVASLSLAMLLFVMVSLAVFRVCGYRLERAPNLKRELSGVDGESAEEPAVTAMASASKP